MPRDGRQRRAPGELSVDVRKHADHGGGADRQAGRRLQELRAGAAQRVVDEGIGAGQHARVLVDSTSDHDPIDVRQLPSRTRQVQDAAVGLDGEFRPLGLEPVNQLVA